MTCQECGAEFEARRDHARFCCDTCRVYWHRRNGREPHEPPAAARAAAVRLVRLAAARQAGEITRGQYAAAAVQIITENFTSVNDALMALGELAAEGMRTPVRARRTHEERRADRPA